MGKVILVIAIAGVVFLAAKGKLVPLKNAITK